MTRTINTTLDAFLSIDRSLLSASILDELTLFSTSEGLGLTPREVIIENIHPPIQVADVYRRVVTASVERNMIITNAQTWAEELLIGAEQERSVVLHTAMADRYDRVSTAQRDMAVYSALIEAYEVCPASSRLLMQLGAFETVIRGSRIYVFSPGMEDYMHGTVVNQSAFNRWRY